jgi:hypothetical protein
MLTDQRFQFSRPPAHCLDLGDRVHVFPQSSELDFALKLVELLGEGIQTRAADGIRELGAVAGHAPGRSACSQVRAAKRRARVGALALT